MSEILARVIRGKTLESIHRGHIAVVDGFGKTIVEIGEPETVTFWRSAAKTFQAIPLITSGAADAFEFSEEAIALACASHSGETFHTKLARQMLAKIGLTEVDLRCGSHPSFHRDTMEEMIKNNQTPTQLNNNCSGKHVGMLAFAKHNGADLTTYLSPQNPVQVAILDEIVRFTGVSKEDIKIGIDGCSAPNFAVPISAMATAFAQLVNPPEEFAREIREDTRNGKTEMRLRITGAKVSLKNGCERIVAAQMKHPEYIGGSERLDTKIMRALSGKMICKIGAEGVWCAGILPSERWKSGLGIALKIEDGDDKRARPVVAIELLRQLGIMTEDAENALQEFSPIILKNSMGLEVGKVDADFRI